jgi:hypothetical protein
MTVGWYDGIRKMIFDMVKDRTRATGLGKAIKANQCYKKSFCITEHKFPSPRRGEPIIMWGLLHPVINSRATSV